MHFYLESPDEGIRGQAPDGTVSSTPGVSDTPGTPRTLRWPDFHKITAAVMEFSFKEWLDVGKLAPRWKQFHPPYNSELEAAIVLITSAPRASRLVFGDSPSVVVFVGQDVESAMVRWCEHRDKGLREES